jgi:hypothetical protein
MMGRRERGQGQFFYAFDLDKVVPLDHLVRQVDSVLDLDWVHKELAPYYSESCCTPPEQSSTAARFAIVPQSAIAMSAR